MTQSRVEFPPARRQQSFETGQSSDQGVGEIGRPDRLVGHGVEFGLGPHIVTGSQAGLGEQESGLRAREEAGARTGEGCGEPFNGLAGTSRGEGNHTQVVVGHGLVLGAPRAGGNRHFELGCRQSLCVAPEARKGVRLAGMNDHVFIQAAGADLLGQPGHLQGMGKVTPTGCRRGNRGQRHPGQVGPSCLLSQPGNLRIHRLSLDHLSHPDQSCSPGKCDLGSKEKVAADLGDDFACDCQSLDVRWIPGDRFAPRGPCQCHRLEFGGIQTMGVDQVQGLPKRLQRLTGIAEGGVQPPAPECGGFRQTEVVASRNEQLRSPSESLFPARPQASPRFDVGEGQPDLDLVDPVTRGQPGRFAQERGGGGERAESPCVGRRNHEEATGRAPVTRLLVVKGNFCSAAAGSGSERICDGGMEPGPAGRREILVARLPEQGVAKTDATIPCHIEELSKRFAAEGLGQGIDPHQIGSFGGIHGAGDRSSDIDEEPGRRAETAERAPDEPTQPLKGLPPVRNGPSTLPGEQRVPLRPGDHGAHVLVVEAGGRIGHDAADGDLAQGSEEDLFGADSPSPEPLQDGIECGIGGDRPSGADDEEGEVAEAPPHIRQKGQALGIGQVDVIEDQEERTIGGGVGQELPYGIEKSCQFQLGRRRGG